MRKLLILLSLGFASAVAAQSAPTTADSATEPLARFVEFKTSAGDFVLELLRQQAPGSTANFEQYVTDGFYDGTIFHRVIGNFVIQGGGFTASLEKKPTREPVVNEADNMLSNDFGTLAMARTAHPHSATSQFYINVADNSALNHTGKTNSRAWGYAVFARIVSGLDTIDKIRSVPTGAGGPFPSDVPLTPITVITARLVSGPAGNDAETDNAATPTSQP